MFAKWRASLIKSEFMLFIQAAIESGELSAERYILYKSLSTENTNNYAKKKEISKWAKAAKKLKRDNYRF